MRKEPCPGRSVAPKSRSSLTRPRPKVERQSLEELAALVSVEHGALLERERAELLVRDVEPGVPDARIARAGRAGNAKVEHDRGDRGSLVATTRSRLLERGDAQLEVRGVARRVALDRGDAAAEVSNEALVVGARCSRRACWPGSRAQRFALGGDPLAAAAASTKSQMATGHSTGWGESRMAAAQLSGADSLDEIFAVRSGRFRFASEFL